MDLYGKKQRILWQKTKDFYGINKGFLWLKNKGSCCCLQGSTRLFCSKQQQISIQIKTLTVNFSKLHIKIIQLQIIVYMLVHTLI